MTKVNSNPGARVAFDVHGTHGVKGVQHSPLISTDIISKSPIDKASNRSLASKTVKSQSKSDSHTLWKVAAVVALAVSSIFLWQLFQSPVSLQNTFPNPFVPLCLKTDERLGNVCTIDDHVFKNAVNHPNPFNPLCPDFRENSGKMCFDENDLKEIEFRGWTNDYFSDDYYCTIEVATQDHNVISNLLEKYQYGKKWDEVSIASSAIVEDFINQGKYDEAFMSIHLLHTKPFFKFDFRELEKATVKKLEICLKSIAINSNTPSIQVLALAKLEDWITERLIHRIDWPSCFKITQDMFKRGFLSESLQVLTIHCQNDDRDINAERALAKKIALATTDDTQRLRALSHYGRIENPFPFSIEIAESLLKKGKIQEAFYVLNAAFNNPNFDSWNPPYGTEEGRKRMYGDYTPDQYALDRVKGIEELYSSLNQLIKTLVANKEVALAQRIVDSFIIAPEKRQEGDYRLWDKEKMDTLIGYVKQATA